MLSKKHLSYKASVAEVPEFDELVERHDALTKELAQVHEDMKVRWDIDLHTAMADSMKDPQKIKYVHTPEDLILYIKCPHNWTLNKSNEYTHAWSGSGNGCASSHHGILIFDYCYKKCDNELWEFVSADFKVCVKMCGDCAGDPDGWCTGMSGLFGFEKEIEMDVDTSVMMKELEERVTYPVAIPSHMTPIQGCDKCWETYID